MINLIIYAVCIFESIFAVSGIDFSKIIYQGAVWQTRFLVILTTFALASGTASLFIFFIDYIKSSI